MQVKRFKISILFTGKINYTAADIMQIILAKEEDASNVADSESATPSIPKHSTTSTGKFIIESSLYSFYLDHIYSYGLMNLALQKHMSITGLMRRLSLIGIDAIWQLSLGCLLMRTIASFLRYTGYLNFINGPINRVLLLILVHVQLLSCLFF